MADDKGMSNSRTVLIGMLVIRALSAQQSPTWTLDEATIAAVLPAIVQGSAVPKSGKGNQPVAVLAGYWLRTMTPPRSAGPGDVTYAWPRSSPTRTFAMTDSGSVMFTEDRARAYGENELEPPWNALVAQGSEPRLDRMLDIPGRGTDDQVWRPIATVKQVTSAITVQAHDGKAVAGVTIAIGPSSWFADASHLDLGATSTAVGLATTGADGVAQLRSVPSRDAHLALAIGGDFLDVPMHLETPSTGPVIVVDAEAVAAIVAKLCAANEAAAVATLKNLASAQAQGRACSANDANGNGKGEYAFLAQLSGAAELQQPAAPGGEVKFVPPVLSNAFSRVRGSCVLRGGYLFQVYLPGKTGWVAEAPTGGARGVDVDATRAESEWCAVAWPLLSGVTGTRVFWVDSNGDIVASASETCSGRHERPVPDSPRSASEALRSPR